MNEHPSNQPPAPPPESDYLWDRSGAPDADVQRLESMLSKFRYKGGELPQAVQTARLRGRLWFLRGLAAAAALALGLVGWRFDVRYEPGWHVERVAGAPVVGGRTVANGGTIGPGEWLQTDDVSRARIRFSTPEIRGHVDVDPGSRVQLVRSGRVGVDPDGTPRIEHRLSMEKGRIDAFVTAAPRLFFVDTPAATAVDYGCAYVLETNEHGRGLLTVTSGLVKLVRGNRDVTVPRGLSCRILPGAGPGTPYREDAGEPLRLALGELDDRLAVWDTKVVKVDLDTPLGEVLAGASEEDAATLWHLLARVEGERRERVYTRLAGLVPPPKGVTKEKVLALDAGAMERWWSKIY